MKKKILIVSAVCLVIIVLFCSNLVSIGESKVEKEYTQMLHDLGYQFDYEKYEQVEVTVNEKGEMNIRVSLEEDTILLYSETYHIEEDGSPYIWSFYKKFLESDLKVSEVINLAKEKFMSSNLYIAEGEYEFGDLTINSWWRSDYDYDVLINHVFQPFSYQFDEYNENRLVASNLANGRINLIEFYEQYFHLEFKSINDQYKDQTIQIKRTSDQIEIIINAVVAAIISEDHIEIIEENTEYDSMTIMMMLKDSELLNNG